MQKLQIIWNWQNSHNNVTDKIKPAYIVAIALKIENKSQLKCDLIQARVWVTATNFNRIPIKKKSNFDP